MKIFSRYILNEVGQHAAIGVALFTFVIFMRDLGRLLEIVVRNSAPLPSVAELFLLTLPVACTITIPMGLLVAEARKGVEAEAQGRQVVWQIPDDFPQVHCDPVLLRQVWGNLLSNALKYSRTRAETCITLSWQQHDATHWAFQVADNGVGFDPQFQDKLFGMFQRLHSASEFEGTGIGLALTRKIVERHGGSIWATGAKDKGCTISFTLPIVRPQDGA